jgi:hypothetical protein
MALDVQGTDFLKLPVGTTAQRPASPNVGMQRWNTDLGAMEYYNGTTWSQAFLQSYSVAIGLADGNILITGGLNSQFTNVTGCVYMYNAESEVCTEKA